MSVPRPAAHPTRGGQLPRFFDVLRLDGLWAFTVWWGPRHATERYRAVDGRCQLEQLTSPAGQPIVWNPVGWQPVAVRLPRRRDQLDAALHAVFAHHPRSPR